MNNTVFSMIGEIIAIGDELTSGRILNTNSRYAAGQLFAVGHEIIAMATIRDTPAEIGESLKRAISRADFVIVTGGLGPTSDDLTNEAVAAALDRPTVLYPEILDKIKSRLGKTPDIEKLAWLPSGAEILKPEARMAGYLLVHDAKLIFFLPGVPYQMRELMADRVIPRLSLWKGGEVRHVRQRVFNIFGLSEEKINQKLKHVEKNDPRLRIGYYPAFPDVHLSLTVIDNNRKETLKLFQQTAQEINTQLADYIYGADEETMAGVVGCLLLQAGKKMSVAESCSGGLVAHKVTMEPGSSDYFAGGVVAYSNDLKELLLSVDKTILEQYGAVSGQTARAMAKGIVKRTNTDIGVSVTGIAGPSGGSDEKPVGTVFFGLATPEKIEEYKFRFYGDRWQIQEKSAQTALDLIRRLILGSPRRQVPN